MSPRSSYHLRTPVLAGSICLTFANLACGMSYYPVCSLMVCSHVDPWDIQSSSEWCCDVFSCPCSFSCSLALSLALVLALSLSLAPAPVLAVLVFSCNKYGISLHDLASAPFH